MNENIKQVNSEEPCPIKQNTEILLETKTGFIAWVKSHKKQLILSGVGITTIIGIILGIKNKDALEALWGSFEEITKRARTAPLALPEVPTTTSMLESVASQRTYSQPTKPFDVSGHIRRMAIWKHHSAEKAAEAAALGIELLPNQTLVDSYTKYIA